MPISTINVCQCVMTITNQKYLFHLRLVWWNDRANDRNVYSTFHEDHFSKLPFLTIIKLSQKIHIPVYLTNCSLNYFEIHFSKPSVSFMVILYWRWPLWLWWLWCYYKGNIQDLLVIPVLSYTTINHLTPTRHYFWSKVIPSLSNKAITYINVIWSVCPIHRNVCGTISQKIFKFSRWTTTKYLKCTISRGLISFCEC